MEIALIAALDLKNGIGKDNKLLCHLPADLRYFKQLTMGHNILMGRKTFESLPNGPLQGRRNIILTKDKNYIAKGCTIYHSVQEIFQSLKNEEKLVVIGGGQIYQLFIHHADILHITKIYQVFGADTFFPKIDSQIWKIQSKSDFFADEKNKFDFSFVTFIRQ
jgi:dihydrofolate reductase